MNRACLKTDPLFTDIVLLGKESHRILERITPVNEFTATFVDRENVAVVKEDLLVRESHSVPVSRSRRRGPEPSSVLEREWPAEGEFVRCVNSIFGA